VSSTAGIEGYKGVDNGWLEDTQLVTTTTRELSFFNRTRAVGPSNCNLRQAGQLPKGEAFEVRAMKLGVAPGGIYGAAGIILDAINVVRATHQATVSFFVQTKPYIDAWPLHAFNFGWHVPSGPIQGAAAATSYFGQGTPLDVFRLPYPIFLPENTTFSGVVTWDIIPAGLTTAVTLVWSLIGTHYRTVA